MNAKAIWNNLAATIMAEMGTRHTLPTILEQMAQAKKEWRDAQGYYNSVYDKDLVDHAVYMMQAAEQKYIYLLKLARREGLTCSPAISQTDGNKIKLLSESYQ
ncbi:MAG: YaaL family protein [Pelosinus sp.]|nr:YaaL family protein [Pelosinus sp.]